MSPEIGTRDTDDEVELTFALPAGRDKRIVTVDSDGAAALVEDPNLLDWRSLTSYDGIWNRAASVIEVAVRGRGSVFLLAISSGDPQRLRRRTGPCWRLRIHRRSFA